MPIKTHLAEKIPNSDF